MGVKLTIDEVDFAKKYASALTRTARDDKVAPFSICPPLKAGSTPGKATMNNVSIVRRIYAALGQMSIRALFDFRAPVFATPTVSVALGQRR